MYKGVTLHFRIFIYNNERIKIRDKSVIQISNNELTSVQTTNVSLPFAQLPPSENVLFSLSVSV